MRWTVVQRLLGDFCADLSLVDWWPLRLVLLAVTVLLAALLVWRFRRRAVRLALLPLVVLLVAVNVLIGVNAYFGYYLTVAQALGLDGEDQGSLAMLNAQQTRPANGIVATIDIPGSSSGFAARPAQVYLPPAWFARPRPRLPVILLLHGTPGSPTDWVDGGRAADAANEWAAGHGGVAPVIVMPDVNGDVFDDTECVDSARGKAERYLTVDVPKFVHSRFLTREPGRYWAVAGLSEGGTCSLVLALRHPDMFAAFADYGGLVGPRDGDVNDPGDTIAALFDGSRKRFEAHEPAALLGRHRFPGLHGYFVVGEADPEPLAATRFLEGLTRRAGIDTRVDVIPGGEHVFPVWSQAFATTMPWLAQQVGLGPPAPPPGRAPTPAAVRPRSRAVPR